METTHFDQLDNADDKGKTRKHSGKQRDRPQHFRWTTQLCAELLDAMLIISDALTREYKGRKPLHKKPKTGRTENEEEILCIQNKNEMQKKKIDMLEKEISQKDNDDYAKCMLENEMQKKKIAMMEKEISQKDDACAKWMARNERLQDLLLNTGRKDLRKKLKQQTIQKRTVSTQTSLRDICQNVENIVDSSHIFIGRAQSSVRPNDEGQVQRNSKQPKGAAEDETGETPGANHLVTVQMSSISASVGNDRIKNPGMNELSADSMLTGSSTFSEDLSGNEEYVEKILSSGFPLPDDFAETKLAPLVYEDDAFFPNPLFTEDTPLRPDDSDPSVTLPKTPNAHAEMEVDYWVNEDSRTDVRLGEQLRAGPDACAGADVAIEKFANNSSLEAHDINNSNECSPSTSGTKRPAQDEPTPEKNKKQKLAAKQRDRPQKNWKWTPQLREEFLDAFMTARDVLTLQNKGTKPNEASVLRYIKRMDTGKKFPSDKILKSTFSNLVIKYQNHVTEKCEEYAKKCREYEQKEHWEYDMEKYQECVRLHQEYQRENSLKFEDIKASDASLKKIKDLLRADLLYGTKL